MAEYEYKEIYLKKSYTIDKMYLYGFIFLFALYCSLEIVHYYFGIDFTGGLLGERPDEIHRRIGVIILCTFMALYFLVKVYLQYLGQPMLFLKISSSGLHFRQPKKAHVNWDDLDKILIKGHSFERKIVFHTVNHGEIPISLDNIDMNKTEFIQLFHSYATRRNIEYKAIKPWNDDPNWVQEI